MKLLKREMAAQVVRENTLKLKFGEQSRNPTNTEIFAFFQRQGWDCDMLSAMYREDFSLFIKFQKEETLKDALRKLGKQVMFEYENGTKIQVAVSASNGMFKYVRVFGLPPEVDDKHIEAVFAKYASIQQMVRERYPAESGFPIWSGARGLNMELIDDIPAQVYVQSIKARVFYDGIQHRCFVCGSTEHLKAECPKRKSVNTRLGSYAHPPVNRTGMINGSSTGSMVLPVPRGSEKVSSVVEERASSSTVASAEPISHAAVVVQDNQESISELEGKDVEGEKIDEVGKSAAKADEWQIVKRLRSKESDSGIVAKAVKIDDGNGPSLMKLQSRRSRSLTPRQKKGSRTAKDEEIKLGDEQFPPLNKP